MEPDSKEDLFANDALEGKSNEPGVRVKRQGRGGNPDPPLNEPDSRPGRGGSSALPLNEPDSGQAKVEALRQSHPFLARVRDLAAMLRGN